MNMSKLVVVRLIVIACLLLVLSTGAFAGINWSYQYREAITEYGANDTVIDDDKNVVIGGINDPLSLDSTISSSNDDYILDATAHLETNHTETADLTTFSAYGCVSANTNLIDTTAYKSVYSVGLAYYLLNIEITEHPYYFSLDGFIKPDDSGVTQYHFVRMPGYLDIVSIGQDDEIPFSTSGVLGIGNYILYSNTQYKSISEGTPAQLSACTSFDLKLTPVPEPSGLLALGCGFVSLVGVFLRKKSMV